MKAGTTQRQKERLYGRITFVHGSFHFYEARTFPSFINTWQRLREVKATQYHTAACPNTEPWAANGSTPAHSRRERLL